MGEQAYEEFATPEMQNVILDLVNCLFEMEPTLCMDALVSQLQINDQPSLQNTFINLLLTTFPQIIDKLLFTCKAQGDIAMVE